MEDKAEKNEKDLPPLPDPKKVFFFFFFFFFFSSLKPNQIKLILKKEYPKS